MRLGLIGLGAIGQALLGHLREGGPRPEMLAVLVRPGTEARARATLDAAGFEEARVLCDGAALLAARPRLVVECAGQAAVSAVGPAVLRAGIDLLAVSVGALADPALAARLRQAATDGGARLILPAGAVGGIDLLAALGAGGGDLAVRYRGTKPPAAWAGTPAESLLDLGALAAPATFFTGSAREAAQSYPKNANVAATLALAGAGFEATEVELIADPQAAGNIHEYEVTSPLARYAIRIENAASAGNAKTSAATALSVLREIRNHCGPVAI